MEGAVKAIVNLRQTGLENNRKYTMERMKNWQIRCGTGTRSGAQIMPSLKGGYQYKFYKYCLIVYNCGRL
jgi:hypothetical protein